ncbi:MAG TPA: flavodoxin family protein [Methanolinea sp.]|nr:flavodoxin family protein [Methanolinea sp.]
MEQSEKSVRDPYVEARGTVYHVVVREEDLSRFYPGMVRYVIEARAGQEVLALSRTNSYEYSPDMPFSARQLAEERAASWEAELRADPGAFRESHPAPSLPAGRVQGRDVVIIQGSPRAGGNSAILASWAAESARREGRKVEVIYPHDMDIHPCIGCYQCYNTGTCVFQDDMNGIIDAVAVCSLLVICSPVYTNSVPAGLKALLDRFMALHAEMTLGGNLPPRKGLLMAVAGRKGHENFKCVKEVIRAFFSLLGMTPLQPVLVDATDVIHDVTRVEGLKDRVMSVIRDNL